MWFTISFNESNNSIKTYRQWKVWQPILAGTLTHIIFVLPLFLWFPFNFYSECRAVIVMFKCLRGQDLNTLLIMSFLHDLLRQLYSLGAMHLLQPRMKCIRNRGENNVFFQFKMFQCSWISLVLIWKIMGHYLSCQTFAF